MSQDGNWFEFEPPPKASTEPMLLDDLVPEPPEPRWYLRLYYRAADRVWYWRWRLAAKIAGCRIDCW